MYVLVHTEHPSKAGPFSVAPLKMDLPFHNNRVAFTGGVPALLLVSHVCVLDHAPLWLPVAWDGVVQKLSFVGRMPRASASIDDSPAQ